MEASMSKRTVSVEELDSLLAAEGSARIGVCTPSNADVDAAIVGKATALAQAHGRAMVVCATRVHVAALSAAIDGMAGAEGVEVVFIQDLALRQLEDERVQAAVLRESRVLDANEMDILTEDVKVCGMKLKRISEMLKFFYHSLADCTAETEGWLVTQEEATVFAILEENLEARRACVPAEVSAKAYLGLKGAGVEPQRCPIVVDNFAALSKSSQRLVEFLSDDAFVAFGNGDFKVLDDEPYPNPAGMTELLEAEDTQAIYVETPAPIKLPVKTLSTPIEEFEYIADYVGRVIGNGAPAESIVVAAPNATWAKQIAKTLRAQGIACALDLTPKKTPGDPREATRCGEIRLHAFAKLLENPRDLTALRTFIGAGDWLVGSDGFLELLAYARENELSITNAISEMRRPENSEAVTVSFKKFLKPLSLLEEAQSVWQTKTVGEIEAYMESVGMPLGSHAAALGDKGGCPDVAAFAATFKPKPACLLEGVTVTTFTRAISHPCKTLVIPGMVDGFMPKRDAVDDAYDLDHRQRALARESRLLKAVEAMARDCIAYTNFDHDLIENTAALHMFTTRYYVRDGRKMARVSPSVLLRQPGELSESSQQGAQNGSTVPAGDKGEE
jgi:hypothetical protein